MTRAEFDDWRRANVSESDWTEALRGAWFWSEVLTYLRCNGYDVPQGADDL